MHKSDIKNISFNYSQSFEKSRFQFHRSVIIEQLISFYNSHAFFHDTFKICFILNP